MYPYSFDSPEFSIDFDAVDELGPLADAVLGSTDQFQAEEFSPFTLDGVFKDLVTENEQVSVLAFPKSRFEPNNFEHYTGKALDACIERGVLKIQQWDLPKVQHRFEPYVVAVCGTSGLDYLVTIASLVRLGYAPFLLDSSLPISTCAELCRKLGLKAYVYEGGVSNEKDRAWEIWGSFCFETITPAYKMLERKDYISKQPLAQRCLGLSWTGDEANEVVLVTHSYGDEPDLTYWTNKKLSSICAEPLGLSCLTTLPLCNATGFLMCLASFSSKDTVFLYNHHVPLEAKNVMNALEATAPQTLLTTMAEFNLMCSTFMDAPCWQEQDKVILRNYGLNMTGVSALSSPSTTIIVHPLPSTPPRPTSEFRTEMETNATSNPIPWCTPSQKFFPEFLHLDTASHQLLVHQGFPTRQILSSPNIPSSSWIDTLSSPNPHLSQSFHPYTGPPSSRLLLSPPENPSLILPLPIEGALKSTFPQYIASALAFGSDRPVPGMLVFRTQLAQQMTSEELLELIYPTVRSASITDFPGSLVLRYMVAVMDAGVWLVGQSRKSVLEAFQKVIGTLYEALEEENGDLVGAE